MHETAIEHGSLFAKSYLTGVRRLKVIDIGAQDVNGSLKQFFTPAHDYVGVDFVDGRGVDVVLDDPYSLPFEDESADVVVCSSCLEHSEFFWLSFMEMTRILKPDGLLYINVPSNGVFHRYPVDCWRFYPDSGRALQNWARKNGQNTVLLESFIGEQRSSLWNDFIAVFLKDERHLAAFPHRILDSFDRYTNGFRDGSDDILNYRNYPQDQRNKFLRRLRRLFQR